MDEVLGGDRLRERAQEIYRGVEDEDERERLVLAYIEGYEDAIGDAGLGGDW